MANFLDLTNSLEAVSTVKEKTRISKEISIFLKEDASLANVAARGLARQVLSEIAELEAILESDFFTLRVSSYKDSDARFKIALGVAFLQDYTNVNRDLDFEIAFALVKEIARRNLDLIINDITVNNEQLRNFDINSAL